MAWPSDLDDMSSTTITTNTMAGTTIGATGSVFTYGTNYGDLTFGPTTTNEGGTLHVRGRAVFEDEVTIGGKNLGETLEAINRRLNILTTDPALESRWAALADLHGRYRELEAECLEAEEMIRILRK